MIVLDKVNTADRPDTTIESVVDDMISQGAQLIFATSDDMRDGIIGAAAAHPEVPMIWASGDSAWAEGQNYQADLTNLGNVMGKIEYGKMIAGCAAALTTQTGHLAYLGPLINDETRRLVNSTLPRRPPLLGDLPRRGPGIAGIRGHLDRVLVQHPRLHARSDAGHQRVPRRWRRCRHLRHRHHRGDRASPARPSTSGEDVWAVPFDYLGACDEAPDVCLGVPYFNWGPSYLATAQSVLDGTFAAEWQWLGPDWEDINNPDTSAVGWLNGAALRRTSRRRCSTSSSPGWPVARPTCSPGR